jgi:hypothetical protein
VFSNQKPTNGKKSHKMFVFAQDMGIRNWVKISFASIFQQKFYHSGGSFIFLSWICLPHFFTAQG